MSSIVEEFLSSELSCSEFLDNLIEAAPKNCDIFDIEYPLNQLLSTKKLDLSLQNRMTSDQYKKLYDWNRELRKADKLIVLIADARKMKAALNQAKKKIGQYGGVPKDIETENGLYSEIIGELDYAIKNKKEA